MLNKLYETAVVSKGGRNGHIKSNDGKLNLNVSFPNEMGGTGLGTNPEQLFAGAFASCFEQALIHMANIHKIKLEDTEVTAHVAVYEDSTGSFQLGAKLDIKLEGCNSPEKLIKLANAACPYSKATRGNIPVEVNLV